MSTQFTNQQKLTLVNVIAWTTLASGIVNLFWGLGLSLIVLMSIIGIVCIPLTILPTILGVFEIIYAAKLISNPPQAVKPSITIAILEIICVVTGNLFSMVVGILALVFYNDLAVKDYFAQLNGTVPFESPVAPATVPELKTSTVPPDEAATVDESSSSDEDTPVG